MPSSNSASSRPGACASSLGFARTSFRRASAPAGSFFLVIIDQVGQGLAVARLDGQHALAVLEGEVGAAQGTDIDPAQAARHGDRAGIELERFLKQGHRVGPGAAILQGPCRV